MYNLKFQLSQVRACVRVKFKIIQKEPQMKDQTICLWWNINMPTWPFLWQSRSFQQRSVTISRDKFQAAVAVKTGSAVYSKATISFFQQDVPTGCTLGKNKQTTDEKRAKACSTWDSCFLPTYSERKTTKNGVTRSLIPWTYPLAGCRMAQINRILSKIQENEKERCHDVKSWGYSPSLRLPPSQFNSALPQNLQEKFKNYCGTKEVCKYRKFPRYKLLLNRSW